MQLALKLMSIITKKGKKRLEDYMRQVTMFDLLEEE